MTGLNLLLSDISKSYGEEPVLKDCSFRFDKKGIYVLMGPNGSGKSTLLRICALLENPDKGEIIYLSDGNAINKDISLKRRITILLPNVGVFNSTVFGNVAAGLRIRGLKGEQMGKRVEDALNFVGLLNKRNQNALTLSSGETQRMGIARAIAIKPDMLFLDEPTASVDMKNTEIIEDIISNMKQTGKTTIVITTHDRSQAERLASSVLIMNDGKIVTS